MHLSSCKSFHVWKKSAFSHLIDGLYGHRVLGWKIFLQSFEVYFPTVLTGSPWHCSGRGRQYSAFILSDWGVSLGFMFSLHWHLGCRTPFYCRAEVGVLVPRRPPWLGAVVPCCCSRYGLSYCHASMEVQAFHSRHWNLVRVLAAVQWV